MPGFVGEYMDDESYDPREDCCFLCGGAGLLEDECTCGDDTCCCLYPEPPLCPDCGGSGSNRPPRNVSRP